MLGEIKMTTAERIRENDKRIETRINGEIDKCKMAYKIKDTEENIFVFSKIENGSPFYRGIGGSKHIFDMNKFKIIEKYIVM